MCDGKNHPIADGRESKDQRGQEANDRTPAGSDLANAGVRSFSVASCVNTSSAPDLCNTGAISSNQPQPTLETGGLDTVYISIYGSWNPGMFPIISKRFDGMKAAAESGDMERSFMQVGDGDMIRMDQAGAKKGVYYRWVFEWEGNRVYVLNRENGSETVALISVQFGSLPLMRNGLDVLWEAFLGLISHLGFKFEREIISRIDPCVDLAGVNVTEFIQPWLSFNFITRGRDGALYFKTPGVYSGMTLGGDRVRFRIYDMGSRARGVRRMGRTKHGTDCSSSQGNATEG